MNPPNDRLSSSVARTGHELDRLATLISAERDALLGAWREQVRALPSARHLDTPTLTDHIPALIVELAMAFRARADASIPDVLHEGTPPAHGEQRLEDGFEIEEVVAEYNILRGCVHDLADRHGIALQGAPFHIMNRVFDTAIGLAVQTYAAQRIREVQLRKQEHLTFVAHDLRTPLTAIALAAHYLERVHTTQPIHVDTARMITTLQRNVRALRALVDQVIVDNAAIEASSDIVVVRRRIDLWPLVEALMNDLQTIAVGAGTRLINDVPEDLVINADANLLRRVLQNLLVNAIKYAPRGEVRVGARAIEDGGIECSVSDDGAGIPSDRLALVWEKYETDSSSEGGLGLGLAIVKSYVEAHGGTVSVESNVGVGSSFLLRFPA
jgi:two-component system, OmpR family, phosphate regulon sensor histidine kinase PhoR